MKINDQEQKFRGKKHETQRSAPKVNRLFKEITFVSKKIWSLYNFTLA